MMSLEKLCLNAIIEEFERFYVANAIPNDEILNRNFQFLKRTYTSELMSGLSEKRKLKKEYLEFLLNVHLKVLKEEWFAHTHYRNSVKDIIYRLPNLSKVFLPTNCSDEILEKIAEFCPQITEINASRSPVTDIGLKYLCKNENGKVPCPELKKLSISSSRVKDEGLKDLIQNLPSLEETDHGSVPHNLYCLHKEELYNFEELPKYNLVYINLRNYDKLAYYNDLLKICLTVCPRLKSIVCHISEIEQLDLFNNILEELDLSFLNEKIDLNNFLKFHGYNLVSLTVHNCIISVRATAENCPKLRYLSVDNISFLEDQENPQASFRCLSECSFMEITDDSATNKAMGFILSSSLKLEKLTFNSCKFSAETKTHLLKCCETNLLEQITFSFTYLEMKFLEEIILTCTPLKTLKILYLNFEPYQWSSLTDFLIKLPNKPNVYVNGICVSDYNEAYNECLYSYY